MPCIATAAVPIRPKAPAFAIFSITRMIKDEVIEPTERFGLHDLKRQNITDTAGTHYEKKKHQDIDGAK